MMEARRVLSATGSLFLHIDYREVHYAKVMLDEVFGRECFQNEIIWAYDYGARAKRRWPAKHDNLLWYTRDPEQYTFNLEAVDRIAYMAPELVGPEKAAVGKTPTDVWWHTIVSPTGKEKTGYPTQKPVGVLERIVKVHSNPGRDGAGLLCRERHHGRGGGATWAGVCAGGLERGGDSRDGTAAGNGGGTGLRRNRGLRWRV